MIHKFFNSSSEKSSIDQQLEENIFFNLGNNNLSDNDSIGMDIARTETEQQIWQGIRAEKKGNLEQAIAHYRLAIEKDLESAKAYQLLSNALKKVREQRQYRSSNLNKSKISESLVESYVAFEEVEVEKSKNTNSKVDRGHKLAMQKTEPKATLSGALSSQQPTVPNLSQADISSSIVLNQGRVEKPQKEVTKTIMLPRVRALASGELVLQKSLSAAEIYVEQALAYFEQKQWHESIAACKEALRICPDIGEAYKVWGNCLQQSGHSAKAIGIYAKALEVQPDMADIYCNLGSIYAKQQKWQQAIEYYQKSSLINPKNASSYRNLAKVWNKLGENEKAAECFFKALELEPSMISAQNHFDLANNLLEENKLDRAIACYKHCVHLEANYFRAYVQLVDALEKKGQAEEALFYYKKLAQLQAKEHQPSEAQAKSTQQICSFLTPEKSSSSKPQIRLQGHGFPKQILQLQPAKTLAVKEQIAKCWQILKQQNSAENWLKLGDLCLGDRQWQNAISSYSQAVKIAPKKGKYYIRLGRAWLKINDEVKAYQSLFQGFSLQPKQVTAQNHYSLGNKLLEHNQIEQAIACYRRAITLEPNLIESYWRLGEILINQGNHQGALGCYQQAIKIKPGQVQNYLLLGKTLAKIQQWQHALACYRKAATIEPNNADIYRNLGEILAFEQKYDQSIKAYRQSIAKNPEFWQTYHQLGEVLSQQKSWHEAIDAFQKAIQRGLGGLPHERLNQEEIALNSQADFYQSYHNLGQVHLELKQWSAAAEAFQHSINTKSDFSWSHYGLGSALLEQKQWSAAAEALNKSIELNPDFDWAYHKLGNAYAENKNWDGAVSAYRRALEITPGLPKTESKLNDALHKRAALDMQEVTDYYTKALEQEPDQESSYFKALEVTPNNPEVYAKLAKLYQDKGDLEQAIAFYKIALQIDPDNSQVIVSLEKLKSEA